MNGPKRGQRSRGRQRNRITKSRGVRDVLSDGVPSEKLDIINGIYKVTNRVYLSTKIQNSTTTKGLNIEIGPGVGTSSINTSTDGI